MAEVNALQGMAAVGQRPLLMDVSPADTFQLLKLLKSPVR